jgi:uncharacterized peroxidase-related enzyme
LHLVAPPLLSENETAAAPCRVPLVSPEVASDPVVKAVYAEIAQELGFGIVPNVFQALASQPLLLRATWDLFRVTMLQGRLPRGVKEMIGTVVSAANRSPYAVAVHLHSLGLQGISSTVLKALASGAATAPGLSPSVNGLLFLAHTAAHTRPSTITDDDLAALEAEGVTPAEWEEALATIRLFQYINSLTDLCLVPVDALA